MTGRQTGQLGGIEQESKLTILTDFSQSTDDEHGSIADAGGLLLMRTIAGSSNLIILQEDPRRSCCECAHARTTGKGGQASDGRSDGGWREGKQSRGGEGKGIYKVVGAEWGGGRGV